MSRRQGWRGARRWSCLSRFAESTSRHPGSRSQGAAQAASHRASYLAADPERDAGAQGCGSHHPPTRAQAGSRVGMVNARGLRATELSAGTGRPGRLLRGVGGAERRTGAAAGLYDAQHGERSGVPSRVSSGDPAGVPRSSRTRLQLLSRRLCGPEIRQPKSCGEEDPPWVSSRGDRALHRLSFSLALQQ